MFRSNFVEDHPNRGQNDGRVALTDYFSGDAQDEKCRCMMEKTLKRNNNGHLLYSCIPCGKEAINTTLKRHIESNLLEGISIQSFDQGPPRIILNEFFADLNF